jgi:Flp pilus assembly protein TadD
MLQRFGDTDDSGTAYTLAFACVRVRGLANDPVRLMRLALKGAPGGKDADRAEEKLLLGAVLLRLGQVRAALPHLLEADTLRGKEPSALDAFFLALTYQGLGDKDRARQALARGIRLAQEGVRKRELSWQQRLNREVLRREAEEALRERE